jgi:hypothetical protein
VGSLRGCDGAAFLNSRSFRHALALTAKKKGGRETALFGSMDCRIKSGND